MTYSLIRKLLFQLAPETAHRLALNSLNYLHHFHLLSPFFNDAKLPTKQMGLLFPNPVGLAAGLDRNADYLPGLGDLGFGFIEVGTVVPQPQAGNPHPRLFRLQKDQALINRMGFASKGLAYVEARLKKRTYTGILGVNIGKNKTTPNEEAANDYLTVMQTLWPYADYFTINVSSPNTEGLRDLQERLLLTQLLHLLKNKQAEIQRRYGKYLPLVLKISPDLDETAIRIVAEVLEDEQMDGVIATNTTIARTGVDSSPVALEVGGLSGKPLKEQSTRVVYLLHEVLQKRIPIIALGGIFTPEDVREKLQAGASLVQVYTSFIYRGPGIISELITGFRVKS